MISAINCICTKDTLPSNKTEVIKCNACNEYQHFECVKSSSFMYIYLCPRCQISKSDFFLKVISNIFKPVLLIYDPLLPINVNRIFLRSFPVNSSPTKPHTLILLRCLQLTEEGYTMHWPEHCTIHINNSLIENYDECSRSSDKFKHRSPIVFWQVNPFESNGLNEAKHKQEEKYLRPSHQHFLKYDEYFKGNDLLTIRIDSCVNKKAMNFVLSLDEIEQEESIEDLMKTIVQVKDPLTVKNLLLKVDILPTIEAVSFVDMYSGVKRIGFPVRGFNCSHLAAFDLETFLVYARMLKKFDCPFCGKNVCLMYKDMILKGMIDGNPRKTEMALSWDYEDYGDFLGKGKEKGTKGKEGNGMSIERDDNHIDDDGSMNDDNSDDADVNEEYDVIDINKY